MLFLHSVLQTETYYYEIYNFSPGCEWGSITNKGPQLTTTFSWRLLFLSILPYIIWHVLPFAFPTAFSISQERSNFVVVLLQDNAGIVSWNKPRQPLPHYSDIIATNFQRFRVFLKKIYPIGSPFITKPNLISVLVQVHN